MLDRCMGERLVTRPSNPPEDKKKQEPQTTPKEPETRFHPVQDLSRAETKMPIARTVVVVKIL